MKPDASLKEIGTVIETVEKLNLKVQTSKHDEATVLAILGETSGVDPEIFRTLSGVSSVVTTTQPFRLASRRFKTADTKIRVGNCVIGEGTFVVMAGPCAVESEEQVMQSAEFLSKCGSAILRGGAFKPRTSPHSFQGLGIEGLRILAKAREKFGVAVITEVMSVSEVPLVNQYADILQIGARNMQNFRLLEAVGKQNKPVLLKRGMMSTIEEWLLSAEYILTYGNPNVILCERGIRTFEKATRNTLDISAVPVVKKLSHLPVIVDPSHAAGNRDYVIPLSLGAAATGADGIIVECHPNPVAALSDGPQSLTLPQAEELISRLRPIVSGLNKKFQESPAYR